MADDRKYEQCKRKLLDTEIAQKKDLVLTMLGEIEGLETAKKSMTATVNAKIEDSKTAIRTLRNEVAQGFVMEEVEVFEFMNEPVTGQKTIKRVDLNEPLRVEVMSAKERQAWLEFPETPPEGSES